MLNLILFVASLASAAPAGYRVTKPSANGCELSLGPAEKDGVVPMRAECVWPEITIEKFNKAMANLDNHDLYWETVVDSTVKRVDGDRSLVFQKHRSKGINDREILLWMSHKVVDGYDRYSWTKATGEALTVTKGNVETARSDGYWQAKAENGGIRVIHTLSYDPGGSVPGFLVRWFQTSGLEANTSDLRAYLAK